MNKVTLTYDKALQFFKEEELGNMKPLVEKAHELLHEKTGAGNDFLGWLDLPESYDKEEYARIK